jgi:ketosteroid isomerase-like protein
MKNNAETVQTIYAAFGRGDVPAILEVLAEDIDWEYAGASSDVPWLQPGRGRAAAVRFFEALAAHVEFKSFTVNDVLEGPNLVVGLVSVEAVVTGTGRTFREIDEAHIWRFDERGRVARFRHAADTHGHVVAWKGL